MVRGACCSRPSPRPFANGKPTPLRPLAPRQTSLQIDAGDVIKLILQFLKENNLSRSYAALQVCFEPAHTPTSPTRVAAPVTLVNGAAAVQLRCTTQAYGEGGRWKRLSHTAHMPQQRVDSCGCAGVAPAPAVAPCVRADGWQGSGQRPVSTAAFSV